MSMLRRCDSSDTKSLPDVVPRPKTRLSPNAMTSFGCDGSVLLQPDAASAVARRTAISGATSRRCGIGLIRPGRVFIVKAKATTSVRRRFAQQPRHARDLA
jgi:hypothetical protein